MTKRVLSRFTYANIMSTLAVFLLLGGVSYAAATLAANSVGKRELKDNAVTSAEVKDKSLKAGDFASGQLPAGPRGPAGATGPAGAAACDDGLMCPDSDLPGGGKIAISIDGSEVGYRLSALLIDCETECKLIVAGPVTTNIEFHAWWELAHLGNPGATKDFGVTVYDGAGTPVRRYFVTGGTPNAFRDDSNRFELTYLVDEIQRVPV